MTARILKALIIFTLMFSLTACNNKDEAKNKDKKKDEKTAQTTSKQDKKVGLTPEPRHNPNSPNFTNDTKNEIFFHDQGSRLNLTNEQGSGKTQAYQNPKQSRNTQNNQDSNLSREYNNNRQASIRNVAPGKKPRNIIVLIGDGMGMGQMEVARLFEHGKEGRLFMQGLPHVALSQTYSADNTVTDSAAAGTAIAAGSKTNNTMIGITPDGTDLSTILDASKAAGKKIGVVSTNTVTDATPAAFYASVKTRAGQDEIARQLFQKDLDVVLGGVRDYFTPKRQNGVDLIQGFKEKGYTYVTNRGELNAAEGTKLIGLFHDSFMNYKIDRDELNSTEPTLTEMTAKTIEFLSRGADKNGFFAMIEGARIDHASHAADFASIWRETIEFDDAVRYAVEWAKKDGNTLVLALADHETMGITATEPMQISKLKNVSVSPEYMGSQLKWDKNKNAFTAESVKDVFSRFANINLNEEQITQFNRRILDSQGKQVPPHILGWEIGTIIAETYHAGALNTEIRSLSPTGGHSANMVPIFGYGVGAENFEGVLDNTNVSKMIAQLAGYNMEGGKRTPPGQGNK